MGSGSIRIFALKGVLLALGLLAAAHALSAESRLSQYCPASDDYYTFEDVCSDCCPPDLSNPGISNAAETTIEGSVSTTGSTGTIEACAFAGGTNPTYTEVDTCASPCVACASRTFTDKTTLDFTAGKSANFTGLTSSTSYRIAYIQPFSERPTNDIAISSALSTTGGGGGGTDLDGVVDYIVDSVNGSDSNDGTTLATAWATLTKLDTSGVVSTGGDICLMDGSTFTQADIDIDWSGASTANMSRIGACYVETGSGDVHWYDEGSGTGRGALPIIADSTGLTCSNPYYFNITGRYIELSHLDFDGDGHETTGCSGSLPGLVRWGGGFTDADLLIRDSQFAAWPDYATTITNQKADQVSALILSQGEGFRVIDNTIEHSYFGVMLGGKSVDSVVDGNTLRELFHTMIYFGVTSGTNTVHDFIAIVTNNTFDCSYGSDAVQTDSSQFASGFDSLMQNIYVGNNEMVGCTGENAIDFKGAIDFYAMNNLITNWGGNNNGPLDGVDRIGGTGGIMHGNGTGTQSDRILVRGNVLWDNFGGISQVDDGVNIIHNTVLNNDFSDFGGHNATEDPSKNPSYSGIVGSGQTRNGDIINNISGFHGQTEYNISDDLTGRVDGNISCTNASHTPEYFYQDTNNPWRPADTLSSFNSNLDSDPGITTDDSTPIVEGDCDFVSLSAITVQVDDYAAAGEDWNLDASSVARAAAVPHSYANGAGSGTTLTVDNACAFFPGIDSRYDTYDVAADYIVIASEAVVQITGRDCSANTLTLAGSRTWSDNDAVWWSQSDGTKYEDSGACEVGVANICD
jgi:hypothetical protein